MRHNWEYKPFKEIANTITPVSKIEKAEYKSDGIFPIVSQEETLISGYWNDYNDITPHAKPIVIFGDHSRVLKYIDFDFVVGADGVKIIEPQDAIKAKFLYYYLHWLDIPSLGYSRHFKLVKEAIYPVPPMEVQERIVAELDELNGVIESKREQLKQLDLLAQSIFYDMFGDPIMNPFAWTIKSISEICEIVGRIGFRGYTRNDLVSKGEGAITLSPTNIVNGNMNFSSCSYISWDKYFESPEIMIQTGDIIFTKTGSTVGKTAYVSFLAEKATINPQLVVFKNSRINNRYFAFVLRTDGIQVKVREKARGSAVPTISQKILGTIHIPVPPIELQNQFAAKVEAIEKQKEEIEKSLKELQTLLDSRLDYWFN